MTDEIVYDTTAVRQNGDIRATRMEGALLGTFGRGKWMLKAYNYTSERGVPGAIVNNVWRRGERIWDNNSFLQGSLEQDFSPRYHVRLMAKYAYYLTKYVNKDTTVLILICCSMCAWFITRVNSKVSKALYYLFVFSMVVPFQMLMFTLSATADRLHLSSPYTICISLSPLLLLWSSHLFL